MGRNIKLVLDVATSVVVNAIVAQDTSQPLP